MANTTVRSRQIKDGDVLRADLNTVTTGSAVITKAVAGTNISLSSTGVDAGTGDVTINVTGVQASSTNLTSLASLTYSSAAFVKMTAAGTFTLDAGDTLAAVTGRGATTSSVTSFTGGDGTNSSVKFAGYNQRGGVGFHGAFEITNTFGTATNPNKYFRLNSTGTLEIINSAYTNSIFQLADSGQLVLPAYTTTTSFTGTTVGYLAFTSTGQIITVAGAGGSLSGSGTANTLTKWTSTTALGNSLITDDGTWTTIAGFRFSPSANLPAATGGSAFFVGNYASPTSGRIFIGDGTGYSFGISKRTGSVTTDLFAFLDSGNFGIGINPTSKLHVAGNATFDTGIIFAGSATSTNGSIILQGNYSSGALTTFGTSFSSGGPVIGYAVSPSTTTQYQFFSATGLTTFPRGALVVEDSLKYFTGAGQTVTVGSAVTMTKLFEIATNGQLKLPNYTSTSSFTGTTAGYLAFDSTGNILSVAAPSGGSGLTWTEVTGTTQTAAVTSGYIANNAAQVVITLPTTAAIGSIIRVTGKGAGGWRLAQNASQVISFGTLASTTGTGGYIQSSHFRDSVEIVCITANTNWQVISSIGNITIV